MAFTEFYVRSGGSNLNSGSTDVDAATLTYAGGTFASPVFTVASGNPVTDGIAVGDYVSVYTTAGATEPGFVARVTARDATTITISTTNIAGLTGNVSAAAGAATLKRGGAWAGPTGAVGWPFNTVTSALAVTATNPVRVNLPTVTRNITAGITAAGTSVLWEAYSATPGDGLGEFTINGDGVANNTAIASLTINGTGNSWRGLTFDGNYAGDPGPTGNAMVSLASTNNYFYRCLFRDAWRAGLNVGGAGNACAAVFEECSFINNNQDDASDMAGVTITEESTFIRCLSKNAFGGSNLDSIGFLVNGATGEPVVFIECIAAGNDKAGFDVRGTTPAVLIRCVGYGNGDEGFRTSSTTAGAIIAIDCVWVENGQFGATANAAQGAPSVKFSNNYFYNNGGVNDGSTEFNSNVNPSQIFGSITLTGDPFEDAPNGNFDLNNTAGAGADVRNTGTGTFYFNGSGYSDSTTGFPDGGAAQHDETAPPAGGQTSYTFG